MSVLFTPLRLRETMLRNRIAVSPMCQYSAREGLPAAWHLVHLGSRAVGGAALVMVEATAVAPEGRISPFDSGIWSDEHAQRFERITRFIQNQESIAAIQLAHAGRKASTDVPWKGGRPLGEDADGWQPLAPSPIPFDTDHPIPREMSDRDIHDVVDQFASAARRSLAAGFQVAEVHMAHGYLLHEFLSPLSNRRTDRYGGSLENRLRLPLEIAKAVRNIWPQELPLLVRISCTDWVEGGWDLEQSIALCRRLRKLRVDLIDCSSGALVPHAKIPAGPGFQTPFAAAIRQAADIATGAVGLITSPQQAEQIVATGQADVVLLAREMLRDPYWPLHAARALKSKVAWPVQYERAQD
jgi:2,4-dienoyl-CoA reductase-like NADH-dependent reductase (Old Yellow Enzyme family)